MVLARNATVRQLVRASAKNLTDTYSAAGYSQAQVVPTVTRNNGNVNITFQVTEGPLNVVRNLTIEGNDTLAEVAVCAARAESRAGQAVFADLVAKDRNQIVAQYLTLGYLNAGFHAMAKPVPGHPHQLDVVYQISEGPQVKTATIITDGRQHTQQSFIDKTVRLKSRRAAERERTCSARRAVCTTWTSSTGPRSIPSAPSPIRPAKTWW